MKNRKRFMALLLATVLVCTQVPSIGSSVTAEETELSTDSAETAQSTDEESGPAAGENEAAAATDDENAGADSSDDSTDGSEAAPSEGTQAEASENTEAEDGALTEAASEDNSEEAADEDTEVAAAANNSISLAGLDEDGGVSAVSEEGEDDEAEDDISLASEDGDSDAEVKEVEYWFNSEWVDGTSTVLNGETIRLYISSVEQRVVYDNGDDEWDEYYEITDFTLDHSSTGRYTDLFIEAAGDGGYYLSFTGKRQGGEDTVIISAIDEEGYELTTEYFYVRVAEEYYVLTYDNGTIPTEDFQIGDTYTLNNDDFTLTRYYTDENGNAQSETIEIDGESYWLRIETDSVDTNALELTGDGSSAVLRKTNWDTNFWVQVWCGEDDYLNDTRVYVDSYDISTVLTTAYGVEDDPTYYYVFNGYDQTITVSMEDGSDFPENTSIGWNVYIPDEILEYVTCEDNGDGSITFTVSDEIPDDYREGYNIDFDYYLMYGGNVDSCSGIRGDAIEVLKEYEEYNTAGDKVLVAGEGYDLYSFYAYVRDYDHPYDADADIVYDDISIDAQYEYTEDGESEPADDDVIELSGDADSRWWIQALNNGYAELEASYTDLNGEDRTCEFTVYVEGERYYLNWAYLEDQWNFLVDETITIDTSLEYVYTNENGDAESYTIEDYVDQGFTLNYEYDEDIISIEKVNDGDGGPYRMLSVTGLSEGGCDIHVYVTDEDGNTVAEDYIWVYVTSEWYLLTADPENVGLGETVDLSALDYVLTRYYTDEDGNSQSETITIDDVNYRVVMADYEWCWKIVEGTEDDILPKLTRTGTYGDSVAVKAQYYDEGDECWYDLWDWCWMYEDISYDSSLTAAYDGVETSNLIVGEAATITLDESWKNEYAFPDGYEVNYEVYVDDNGWQDASEYGAEWTVEDNVLSLTVDSDEYTYIVCARGEYEGNEFTYTELWLSASEESVTYYAESDAWRILKGGSTALHAYQIEYSTEHPEGEVTELQITRVEAMKPSWSDDDDPDLSIFSFDVSDATEDGLKVTGVDEGWRCMYIYATVDGKEVRCDNMDEDERYIYIEVTSGYYYLDLEDSYTINLQEEDTTITLSDILRMTYLDENGETVDIPAEFAGLNITMYSEEDDETYLSYDDNIISVDVDEDVITITGLNEGETGLQITAYGYDEYSNELYEMETTWITIYVQGKYDAEITQSDGSAAVTEYTEEYGAEFNLGLVTGSDNENGLQYKVVEGTDVVTVDEDGNVTVIGVGTAVIKVWVEEGDSYYETEITITVVGEKAAVVFENDDAVTKTLGDEPFVLAVKTDNSESVLSYSSSDESVVTVDASGKVTVVGAGTAVITVTAAETDYFKAAETTVTVTVNKAAATIAPETSTQTVTYGKSIFLTAENLGLTVTGDGDLIFTVP
ncbi:MAG: hypothetical protein LUH53_06490, partial [Lachnospiraceae bacterium]|nr:hypothetical protein [Lachnospiraceae bacterium]